MLISGTHIEDACKNLLQKELSFELKNKVLKKGKLILFFQRNFHLVFILDNNKKVRDKIELPIPFQIEHHKKDNLVYFDYRISTLSKHFFIAEPYLTLYTPKFAKNKFFDTILTITSNSNE